MDAFIDEEFGDVEGVHAAFGLAGRREHGLVHAQPVEGEFETVFEPLADVVGVEDRVVGCFFQAFFAQKQRVGVSPQDDGEVAVKRRDITD